MANGIGIIAEEAKGLIVREIWDLKLQKGDRIPSCAALAKKLNIGKTTLFRSLKTLVDEGVLSTQDRVGFFVEDPKTPGHSSYQIALVIGNSNSSPETNLLSVYLQNSCLDAGCRCVLLHSCRRLHNTTEEDSLSAHLGLRQQIERGEIQGILSQIAFSEENTEYLKQHHIPFVLCAGQSDYADLNSFIELESGIRKGMKKLQKLGCRHLLGITADCFRPLFPESGCLAYSNFEEVSTSVLKKILAMPPAERPDGFFFSDAMACQLFYGTLMRKTDRKYCPPAVMIAPDEHIHLKKTLPAEVHILGFSMKGLADASVQLLLKNIHFCSGKKQTATIKLEWQNENDPS